MNKKMVTIIAALAMCTAMAGCTGSYTASSSKAETTTTTNGLPQNLPLLLKAQKTKAQLTKAQLTALPQTQARQIMTLTAISGLLNS